MTEVINIMYPFEKYLETGIAMMFIMHQVSLFTKIIEPYYILNSNFDILKTN